MATKQPSIMSSRDMDSDEAVKRATIPEIGGPQWDEVEIVQPKDMMSKAEELKFMNEQIQVLVEESENENAPMFVCAGHNGTMQYFRRGVAQLVKRKFVYSLLQANAGLVSVNYGKRPDGNEFNSMAVRKKRTHGVTLIEDKNPKGREWFSRIAAAF